MFRCFIVVSRLLVLCLVFSFGVCMLIIIRF